jgi:hypothetical protein
MFGLEGSGFIISLAMTFFLVGLVMYYVRQRLNDQEKQLNQLVSIIPVMSQQLQLHELALNNNSDNALGADQSNSSVTQHLTTIPEESGKINVSDNDVEESDTDTDSDSNTDDSDEDNYDIKNIKLGGDIQDLTVADIETELGNQLQAMAMSGHAAMGSVRVVSVHAMGPEHMESLEDIEHNIHVIDDKPLDASTKSNESDDDDDDDDSDDDDDDDDDDDSEQNRKPLEITKTLSNSIEDISKTVMLDPIEQLTNESLSFNYSKMAVAALREVVVDKNLATSTDAAKLKKKKLLELLK